MTRKSGIDEGKALIDPAPAVALEIYKQKYENFRHFDKLRWSAIPLVFGAAGLFSISRDDHGNPSWWALMIFGGFSIITGWSMRRLNLGVEKNRKTLHEIGALLGDHSIPSSPPVFGASTVFSWVIMAIGCMALTLGVAKRMLH